SNELVAQPRILLHGPTLRGTVRGPGSQGYANRRSVRPFPCAGPHKFLFRGISRSLFHMKLDFDFLRESFHPTGAPKQLQIIIRLVCGNLSSSWYGDGVSKQESSPVSRIADSFWDSCAFGNPCRLKCVLKQDGDIEFHCTQFARKPRCSRHSFVLSTMI